MFAVCSVGSGKYICPGDLCKNQYAYNFLSLPQFRLISAASVFDTLASDENLPLIQFIALNRHCSGAKLSKCSPYVFDLLSKKDELK